jgi:hypothetical protein
MMSLRLSFALFGLVLVGSTALGVETKKPDVAPPASREQTVELARRLAQREQPPALVAEMVQPFNPVAFGQPDPEELQAIAASRAAAANASAAAKPANDSDLLQLISTRVTPSGTLILGGEPMLIFGKKRLRVGDHLTVTYDGRDYDLELIGITRTAFSLRLNANEITRPIKPGKPQ